MNSIFKFHSRVLFCLCFTFCSNVVFCGDKNMPDVKEVMSRSIVSAGNQARLYNFFMRAEAGNPLTIGVLGGSITQGAACSKPEFRYHGIIMDWLRHKFPKSQFKLVNAGIGATASDYGALRCERDLLLKKPDLVVLEFAVNDNPPSKAYAETYEGVVRQILNAPGHPALILLFMMWKDGHNAQKWQTKIGTHYTLPMISYRDALWPEIKTGKLQWKELSPDIVHPNQNGHSFAGKLLCSYLNQAWNACKKTTNHKAPSLPEPLLTNRYEKCVLYDGPTLKPILNRGWTYDAGNRAAESGWRALKNRAV